MQFKLAFAAVLATAVAAVNGAATGSAAVQARAQQADSHVFVCTDGGFSGDCTNWGITAGVCSTFTSEFQDDISSIGPDQGWTCNAYSDFFCNDDEGHIVVEFPGISHLGDLGWNDKISSILCNRS